MFRFTEADVQSLVDKQPFASNPYHGLVFVGNALDKGEELTAQAQQEIEHTGNDSQNGLIDNQYFVNAVLIQQAEL